MSFVRNTLSSAPASIHKRLKAFESKTVQNSITDQKIQAINSKFLDLVRALPDNNDSFAPALENGSISTLDFLSMTQLPIDTFLESLKIPSLFTHKEKSTLLIHLAQSIDYHFKEENQTLLEFSSSINELITFLLKNQISINTTTNFGSTPLDIALDRLSNDLDPVTRTVLTKFTLGLLFQSANVNHDDDNKTFELIENAFATKNIEIIREMISRAKTKKNADKNGNTLWHLATIHLHEQPSAFNECSYILKDKKIPISMMNHKGTTPCHILCSLKINPKIHLDDRHLASEIQTLVDCGGNAFYKDDHGLTPMALLKSNQGTFYRKEVFIDLLEQNS